MAIRQRIDQMMIRPSSQQRCRPDIPTIKRLQVDPEKLAAVFKACKELQVPLGGNVSSDETSSDDDADEILTEGKEPRRRRQLCKSKKTDKTNNK